MNSKQMVEYIKEQAKDSPDAAPDTEWLRTELLTNLKQLFVTRKVSFYQYQSIVACIQEVDRTYKSFRKRCVLCSVTSQMGSLTRCFRMTS